MASPSDADIADLTAAAYEAGLEGALWPGVLERLRTAFGAQTVNLSGCDVASLRGFMMNAGSDPAAIESYMAHYIKVDPVIAPISQRPVGRVFADEMLLPKAAYVRTEYYTDWVRPQGLWHNLIALTMRDGPLASGFVITRGRHQAAFDGQASEALETLLPHLGRAVRITCRLAAAEARGAGVEALLGRLREGALLLGADGAVLYANPPAEALLRAGDGLTTAQGRLRATRPANNRALRRALAAAAANAGGCSLSVERPSGAPPLAVTVQPATAGRLAASDPWRIAPLPAVLVFVVDPTRPGSTGAAGTLRALCGLTAAEAAVAEAIAEGQGVKDAAEALGVASTTVRWHLQRVFEKTGTTRQAELARLVERLGAVAGGGDRV